MALALQLERRRTGSKAGGEGVFGASAGVAGSAGDVGAASDFVQALGDADIGGLLAEAVEGYTFELRTKG